METRLSGQDVALEADATTTRKRYAPIAYLAADREPSRSRVLEAKEPRQAAATASSSALESLDPRSRRIIEDALAARRRRRLTLHELADEFRSPPSASARSRRRR